MNRYASCYQFTENETAEKESREKYYNSSSLEQGFAIKHPKNLRKQKQRTTANRGQQIQIVQSPDE